MSHRSIICLKLQLGQTIDLLTADKSQYFAQPHPIIVNYFAFLSMRAGMMNRILQSDWFQQREKFSKLARGQWNDPHAISWQAKFTYVTFQD